MEIRAQVDAAYKWGMTKVGTYRHAGTDVKTVYDDEGVFHILVDQEYYVEGLMDVEIPPERLRDNGALRGDEVAACRASLGALQWLAVQSQPQLCSRCNLLLTEVVTEGTLAVAREIQAMITEIRREHFQLCFFKLRSVNHWSEVTFISMGDQAHGNRPKGDSTGGLVTLAAGPEACQGQVCAMILLSWRTWKLKRKSISSNDAEVQSILEAEDNNFRVRVLWSELHSAGPTSSDVDASERHDLVERAEHHVLQLRGILCTDS